MSAAPAMPFGATVRADATEFTLWAPQARRVALSHAPSLAAFANSARHVPATPREDGWWHFSVTGAGAGTAYQWRIDGEISVPDPASRSNPGGPHQPSVVVDPTAFGWTKDDDAWTGRPWSEVVLYELHVGSFTPEGTYAAAAGQLPRLKAIGITAVELMPVASFPGRFGWGYDGVLPFAPQAAYGTPDDLKRFAQAAHRLGLMVFLDVVYNHFGPDGNYLGRYADDFFSKTHSSPWGAAINFDGAGSAAVREFFIANALYWLQEYRFDGLRLDAVHAIHDASAPDVLEELSTRVREATLGRQVHLVLENENNEHHRLSAVHQKGRFTAQWNDDFHHALHVLLTGETRGYYADYGRDPLALLARTLTHGFAFAPSPRKEGGARATPEAAPAQPLWAMVNYANNHDQVGNRAFGERLGELVGPDTMQVALLLALLTPATPMLFFGDELGAQQPFYYFADWQGDLRQAVIEGRQREFGHMLAGAPTGPDGRARELPNACEPATFEAGRLTEGQEQTDQARVWQELVTLALAARREWIAPRQLLLAHGRHDATLVGPKALQVRWRYTDGVIVWMDINLDSKAIAEQDLPAGLLTPPRGTEIHSHNWSAAATGWPAHAARWRVVKESS